MPSSRPWSTACGRAFSRYGRPASRSRSRWTERSSDREASDPRASFCEGEAMHATVVDAAGSSRAAVGSWPLTTRVTSPRPAFRASFELDLAPLVPTTRFAVAAAATVFEAAFRQIELDAPLSSLRDLPGGNAVACELDAPREVRIVGLAGSVSLQAGASYSIALYRL